MFDENNEPEIIGIKDMLAETHSKLVAYDKENQLIKIKGLYSYEIECDRLKTPEQLIQWINHLTGKLWVTRPMIRDFIDATYTSWGRSLYDKKGVQ